MKKRLSRLTALFLSMVLAFSLVLPALAFEDTDPPLWAKLGYSSMEELLEATPRLDPAFYEELSARAESTFDLNAHFQKYLSPTFGYDDPQEFMEDYSLTWEEFECLTLNDWVQTQINDHETQEVVDRFAASHPEEFAAFDPYVYFQEDYYFSSMTPEAYMEDFGLTREEFEREMLESWVYRIVNEEEERWTIAEYIAAHPEEYAAFDPEEYFSKAYPFYDSIEEYMEDWELTQEEFEEEMLGEWVQAQLRAEQQEQEVAAFQAKYPEECAAFDPNTYFMNSSHYFYDSPQEYMELRGMTETEFYREMFLRWMDDFQSMAIIKETLGGSARGINVMVDGECIPFPSARPELVNGRTMVPLAAMMEHLGAQVSYDQNTQTVSVTMDGLSFTHVAGTDSLTLADGSTVKMDAPSYIQDGRTMVPVAFFAQQLGYDVYWDSGYRTAVLIDLQGLADEIDQEFTLFNRVLYAASGAGLVKEGQATQQAVSLDLDITLFDTLNGDERIPVKLRGTVLYNDQAVQLTLSGNLSALVGRYPFQFYLSEELTDEEFEQLVNKYHSALSSFSLEVILNLEAGAVYFRCPSLSRLSPGLVEDPDAWIAVPADLSQFPLDSLTGVSSVGQLALGSARNSLYSWDNMDTPFWYWNNIASAAYTLSEYVGDEQFTKSGGSYTRVFDLDPYNTYNGGLTAALKITPSGEHSCTYSLTCDFSDPDGALKLNLSGSSGKTDLDLFCHIKNEFKFTMDVDSRISGASKQPLSVPPAGSKVEYPLGAVGSRDL